MSEEHAVVLERALDGEVTSQEIIDGWSDEQLRSATEGRQFTLRAASVARVLSSLTNGAITPTQAQRWASFMRWGYVASTPGRGGTDVDIEYEAQYEDAIIEAIARLDELGDLIDGDLRPGEADQLLAALC